jgi:hypothetical protein
MVAEIKEYVQKNTDYSLKVPTSMPFCCKRETCLFHPDIILMKKDIITHIVEPETSTGGTLLVGKVVLADRSIELMVNNGQIPDSKPKLVFLYSPKMKLSELERVRYRVDNSGYKLKYIGSMIIDYYPANWSWLD